MSNNSNHVDNRCQAWVYQVVWNAMGRTSRFDVSRPTAMDAHNSWVRSTSRTNIPVGAAVYFRTSNPAGHVGIHIGDNMIVHTSANGVRNDHLNSMPGTYLGWGWQAGIPLH